MKPRLIYSQKIYLMDEQTVLSIAGNLETNLEEANPLEQINPINNLDSQIHVINLDWSIYPWIADSIIHQLQKIQEGNNPCRVILRMDSPGGCSQSVNRICSEIESMKNAGYEFHTSIMGDCCSGAYWIACSTQSITAEHTTCRIGSVGVIVSFMNYNKMLEQDGVKIITVRRGDRKAKINQVEEVDKEALSDLQEQVDIIYNEFTTIVSEARNIPMPEDTDEKDLHAPIWRSKVFLTNQAVDNGLIDAVQSFDEKIEQIQTDSTSTNQSETEGTKMIELSKANEIITKATEGQGTQIQMAVIAYVMSNAFNFESEEQIENSVAGFLAGITAAAELAEEKKKTESKAEDEDDEEDDDEKDDDKSDTVDRSPFAASATETEALQVAQIGGDLPKTELTAEQFATKYTPYPFLSKEIAMHEYAQAQEEGESHLEALLTETEKSYNTYKGD